MLSPPSHPQPVAVRWQTSVDLVKERQAVSSSVDLQRAFTGWRCWEEARASSPLRWVWMLLSKQVSILHHRKTCIQTRLYYRLLRTENEMLSKLQLNKSKFCFDKWLAVVSRKQVMLAANYWG